MFDLTKIKKIYFVGIGGIGMSATAGIAKGKGFEVAGSDAADIYDPAKSVLEKFGIKFALGFDVKNIDSAFNGAAPDLVVATSAVDKTNLEIAIFQKYQLPIISYPELLGALATDKKRIVVVGTHGKGTTSGLISWVLKNLYDDSFFVGAVLNNLQTNFYAGTGKNFVIEGDEYKSSAWDDQPKFMHYSPDILLINNLEFDHPDIYKDLDAFKNAFKNLVSEMPSNSVLIYNADDQNVLDVIKDFKYKKVGFGFKSGKIIGSQPQLQGNNFEIKISNQDQSQEFLVQTIFPGMPYAYDVLAAAAVLLELRVDPQDLAKYILQYTGVKRRYEIIADDKYTIIDDYAHHPTAVKQTLEATRMKYPSRRIVCFFEPHTYSRTKETLGDLARSFGAADLAYIAEVYPAREQKTPASITGAQVVAEIAKNHGNVQLVENKADALEKYAKMAQPGDVILVMAVGSFNTLVYDLKQTLLQ